MSKIDETWPTWQKVDLTKIGYILQRENAKAALLADLLELVGEDDSYNDFCDNCSDWDEGRNNLRLELRDKLKEYFK